MNPRSADHSERQTLTEVPYCGAVPACGIGPPGGLPPGLVSSSTNPPLLLDTHTLRAQRKRRSITMACDSTDVLRKMAGFRSEWVMVTLTYREIDGYRPNDLAPFVEALRKWLARRSAPMVGVWSGELQQRGALHYHVLLLVPRGLSIPKPDKRGWWIHGMTKVERVRRHIDASRYIGKYISKDQEARFPLGCRTHARWGMTEQQRRWIRYQLMPAWARARWPDARNHDLARAIGGGIVERNSGECAPSPFTVILSQGRVWLVPNNSTEGRENA